MCPTDQFLDEQDQDERSGVEAVDRFGRICKMFSPTRSALTAAEIASGLGTPLRSMHKILATLEHHKLLMRAETPDKFMLGFGWLRFSTRLDEPIEIRRPMRPVMRRLRDAINETVILTVRVGDNRINIEYAESTHAVRRIALKNSNMPLHVGAAGRTLMAGLPDAEIDAYLQRVTLENIGFDTPTDPDRIRRDIRTVRTNGYLVLVNEITEGAASISVPIKDYSGQSLAALTVGGPLIRFNEERRAEALPLVLEAAGALAFNVEQVS